MNESIYINKDHKEIRKIESVGLNCGLESRYLIKFQEKKRIYEVNDWLEVINEIKDNKTASEWQTELSKISSEIKQVFNEDKVEE
jgi:hypothetical protein